MHALSIVTRFGGQLYFALTLLARYQYVDALAQTFDLDLRHTDLPMLTHALQCHYSSPEYRQKEE